MTAAIWSAGAELAAPGLRWMLARRARRGREVAARLAERWGIEPAPRPPGKLLWLHAASVGEAISVLPVLSALADLAPHIHTLLTTGTVTSAALLAQRLPELGLAGQVTHRFAPLDVPSWASRFLDHWRPQAAAFVESELWPNLLAACRARRIPTVLINARLSVRSAAQWGRLPGFAAQVIGGFTWIEAQSEADAQRLRSLGGGQVGSAGNLKLAAPALPVDRAELARLAAILGHRPRWLAASTHPGDEALAAEVHARLLPGFPGLVTAIVPRHPERGEEIAASLGMAPRRANGENPPHEGLWIGDTLGELGLFYRLFPTVFIGKSFAPGGGQNPLEPARLGCAIAAGPAMQNFADPAQRLINCGGLTIIGDAVELTAWVARMLRDPTQAAAVGRAAAAIAGEGSDLPARIAARLAALMP